jgi:hypothetical protein
LKPGLSAEECDAEAPIHVLSATSSCRGQLDDSKAITGSHLCAALDWVLAEEPVSANQSRLK